MVDNIVGGYETGPRTAKIYLLEHGCVLCVCRDFGSPLSTRVSLTIVTFVGRLGTSGGIVRWRESAGPVALGDTLPVPGPQNLPSARIIPGGTWRPLIVSPPSKMTVDCHLVKSAKDMRHH